MSESNLYKIGKTDGKGVGAIALKDIPKGTLILKESPQFVVHDTYDKDGNINPSDVIPKLMKSFNQMVKDDQKEYLNLRSNQEAPNEVFKIYEIYVVNMLFLNKYEY